MGIILVLLGRDVTLSVLNSLRTSFLSGKIGVKNTHLALSLQGINKMGHFRMYMTVGTFSSFISDDKSFSRSLVWSVNHLYDPPFYCSLNMADTV